MSLFGMTDTKRAAINSLLSQYNALNREFDALIRAPKSPEATARIDANAESVADIAAQIRALDPHGVITS